MLGPLLRIVLNRYFIVLAGLWLFFILFFGKGLAADKGPACLAAGKYEKQRKKMVTTQIQRRGISDPVVLQAMLKVPRHCFVPRRFLDEAYDDHPLPIGQGQTISQPYIVALMTELLKLKGSDSVLEIGTGSGYQSCILSQIVRQVYTIEIYPELAQKAGSLITALGYKNVKVKTGDGYYGWPENGPFDAIMVTAAASEIPPPLLRQLKPGGRMCIPVGGIYQVQQLVLVEKDLENAISTRIILQVRFVPLLGKH